MDKERIARFADSVYQDMAGAMSIGMGYVGQRTGLSNALAEAGPATSADLADRARYKRPHRASPD